MLYKFYYLLSLRNKGPYSELFLSVFSRIRNEYGEIPRISSYSVRMLENTDQNKSEYGHFLRSVCFFKNILAESYPDLSKHRVLPEIHIDNSLINRLF